MNLFEKEISKEYFFKGKIINLRVDNVSLPNGETATREVVEHPGGVGIVALDGDDILLVRQYRRPYDELVLEIPAGKLNYGENHKECGIRELEEETGYKAGKFSYLGYNYPTPGFCNEKIHIYLAEDLKKGEMKLDDDEFLNVERHPFKKAVEMVMKGEIYDSKTIIGILKTFIHFQVGGISAF